MATPRMQGKPYLQEHIDFLYLVDHQNRSDIFDQLAAELERSRGAIDFCLRWRDDPDSFPPGAANKIRRQFDDARNRLGEDHEGSLSIPEAYRFLKSPKKSGSARAELLKKMEQEWLKGGEIDSEDLESALARTLRSVLQRRGQQVFRGKLMVAYGGRCAVSGWDGGAALEAAHIIPYAESGMNEVGNGLLLRADIHTLFDQGLITIDPDHFTVSLSAKLKQTKYQEFDGKKIRLPADPEDHPSRESLQWHLDDCGGA